MLQSLTQSQPLMQNEGPMGALHQRQPYLLSKKLRRHQNIKLGNILKGDASVK